MDVDLGEGPHVVVGLGAVGGIGRRSEVFARLGRLSLGLVKQAKVELGVEVRRGAQPPVVAV